ncbi:MAG: DUF1571 domain-containing protein [Betaproteobacteria bacterium]|nr:DUF1571 domain-containing protein [Betaproteobacteria bacterium]
MLAEIILMAMLAAEEGDLVSVALRRFEGLEAYQVTLSSSGDGRDERIRYFYRKPGFIRMEFEQPFGGAVLVYDPAAKRARLWPFGLASISFNLSPDNRLIRSRTGQRVDRSHVGALLANVRSLQQDGDTEPDGAEEIGGRSAHRLIVTGRGGHAVERVHRYRLWLDRETLFPLKVASYDEAGALIETVTLDAPKLNGAYPEGFFKP